MAFDKGKSSSLNLDSAKFASNWLWVTSIYTFCGSQLLSPFVLKTFVSFLILVFYCKLIQ